MADPRQTNVYRYWSGVAVEAARESSKRVGFPLSVLAGLLALGALLLSGEAWWKAVLVGVGVPVAFWLVVTCWYLLAIPARRVQEIEGARRDIMIVQQRGGARLGLLEVARTARENALRARKDLELGNAVDVADLHGNAVRLALLAVERLETARYPMPAERGSFSRAVDGDPADAAKAIAQLEDLARAIDQQVLEARYP
jgi:hypothetical protein